MALASGQEIHFYRSANLIDWTFCSAFGEKEGIHTDHPWECPDLFQLNISGSQDSRWILVVGIGACEKPFGSFTQYFVGNFNGYEFINENASDQGLLLDQGRDLYAVQSWSDSPDGKRLILGWLNNWKYAKEVPASSYRGMMSVPRFLNLVSTPSGLRISQSFCVEIPGDAGDFDDCQMKTIPDTASVKGARRGRLLFDIDSDSLVDLTFFGTQSPDLRLSCKGERISVQILRSTHSGEASFLKEFEHDYQVEFICAGEISMEWVTDRNSLEVLFDNGRVSISQLMITDNPGQYLEVQPVSGSIKVLQHQEYLIS
jgi:fructan beta-fructosidase